MGRTFDVTTESGDELTLEYQPGGLFVSVIVHVKRGVLRRGYDEKTGFDEEVGEVIAELRLPLKVLETGMREMNNFALTDPENLARERFWLIWTREEPHELVSGYSGPATTVDEVLREVTDGEFDFQHTKRDCIVEEVDAEHWASVNDWDAMSDWEKAPIRNVVGTGLMLGKLRKG